MMIKIKLIKFIRRESIKIKNKEILKYKFNLALKSKKHMKRKINHCKMVV